LSRDEIAEIFIKIGMKFPYKRADDLFYRSNSDGDTTISVEEFIAIYRKELG
jgi:Ca2+-binding EF-hand superfamily protein